LLPAHPLETGRISGARLGAGELGDHVLHARPSREDRLASAVEVRRLPKHERTQDQLGRGLQATHPVVVAWPAHNVRLEVLVQHLAVRVIFDKLGIIENALGSRLLGQQAVHPHGPDVLLAPPPFAAERETTEYADAHLADARAVIAERSAVPFP